MLHLEVSAGGQHTGRSKKLNHIVFVVQKHKVNKPETVSTEFCVMNLCVLRRKVRLR